MRVKNFIQARKLSLICKENVTRVRGSVTFIYRGYGLKKNWFHFWLDNFSIPFSLKNKLKQWRCNGRFSVFRLQKCAYNMVYQVVPDTSLQDKIILLLLKIRIKTLLFMPSVHHSRAHPRLQGQSAHNSSQDPVKKPRIASLDPQV